tara:strand:+ start:192 stop:593 length:402 start_codon:yes stop_codon:yes gene_type:complete
MARESKYREGTKMFSYRIPLSLYIEVELMVKNRLLDYERSVINGIEVTEDVLDPVLIQVKKVDKKEKKKLTAKQYNYLDTLPFGAVTEKHFSKNDSIKTLDGTYYTKRFFNGKLEVIEHENRQDAYLYADNKF